MLPRLGLPVLDTSGAAFVESPWRPVPQEVTVNPFAPLDALAPAEIVRRGEVPRIRALGLLITAVLVVACGTGGVGPPRADITGTWSGTWSAPNMGNGTVEFRLAQKGADVTGELVWRGSMEGPRAGASINPSGPLKGNVAGSVFSFDRSPSPVKGDLTIEGDEMKGIVTVMRDATVRVRRQR